ncbi:MAG: alpha-L-rhamnosidase N-terminal domain-containing protein [Pirellulales bacterium]|nr:alpha-L-rhamnosidase N-terminal domain-containing protein [Pirellulales bacterium]
MKTIALVAVTTVTITLFLVSLVVAEDNATGPALQRSMIWLDSATFGKEVYAVFRKELKLSAAPERAVLHIFADTRYMLWINGQYVERGPCRFVPSHPEYDTLDVTSYLRQGNNALAVIVHHYHDGVMKDDGSEVNGRVARHVPGLTAMLDISEPDGRHTSLSTDTSWRGSTKTRFGPSGVSTSSIPDRIDARRDAGDWTLPGFDDSTWEKPVRVNGRLWGPLGLRTIPLLRETEIEPLTLVERAGKATRRPLDEALPIKMKAGEELVIDAGQFVLAYSVLDLDARDGSELELEYSPRFFDTDRKPDRSHGHINRYIARTGRQTYMSGDTFGCKYVIVRLKSGEVCLHGIRLVNRLYPFEVVGRYQSNDTFLNLLWQIGINTLLICSEDSYVDCATRERAQWLGDGVVVTSPLTRIALAGPGPAGKPRFADLRLFRQMLRQMGHSVLPDGRVKAFSPSDGFDKHGYIEDYACLWIQGIRSYCDVTDDIDLARELWPTVTGQLKWFLHRLSPRGLVNAREFVFPGNPLAYAVCEGSTLNAYLYRALIDAAELARQLDKLEQHQQYKAAAETLKQAINTHLWNDEAGAYYGGISNGHKTGLTAYAAMMCLYFEVVPTERKDRVNQWLLANYDKENYSPYAYTFLFEVFYRMDSARADQLVLDLMRQRWAEMVKGETQTTREGFNGLGSEPCHIMGSTPTYHLSRHVLGVGVDEPVRDRRIIIEPRMGDLRHVEGTVVTEFGPVPVLWEKAEDGKSFSFEVRIPDNVTAKLHLPRVGDAPVVVVDGQTTKSSEHGRCLNLELGSGKHVGFVKDVMSVKHP